jgi:hypothetical protein
MYLLHRASDGRRGHRRARCAAGTTRDMFLGKDGNPVRGMSINTALAAGIPVSRRACADAVALRQADIGTGAQACNPPASEGFDLYPRLQAGLRSSCAVENQGRGNLDAQR